MLVIDRTVHSVSSWPWGRIRCRTWVEAAVSFLSYSIIQTIINNCCSRKISSGPNGNAINPAYISKSGAFNGTGIAIASYSFATGGYGVINVYFQHWTGQLRKMQLMSDGTWQGGDSTNIVATDARNGTPISAVAYAMDRVSTVSSSHSHHLSVLSLILFLVAYILHRQTEYYSRENLGQCYQPVERRAYWEYESSCHERLQCGFTGVLVRELLW
jgi:hypothetical protein